MKQTATPTLAELKRAKKLKEEPLMRDLKKKTKKLEVKFL